MGWFSKIWKKVKSVVKKVVKSVKKVASKVWSGIKNVAKKVGKAVNKLGPLASIAIGFIPGFQGLWANAGIWGAMGKGAITGFITSGGKLKGALAGAAMGGIGYAAVQGASAFKGGMEAAGTNASISEQITQGFKAVGASTSQGVTNMYESASNLFKGGEGGLNYLTNTGESVYKYGSDLKDPLAQGESVYSEANAKNMESIKKGLSDYDKQYMESNKDIFEGYDKRQMDEILEYSKQTGENLETSQHLWEQTGGVDLDQSFDYKQLKDGTYRYTGEGLETTLASQSYSLPDKVDSKTPKPSSSAATPSYEKYAIQTGQDIGKWSNTKALQGASQGRAGGGFDQMFDVRQLGLMRGTDMASLLAKQTYGLS